MSTLKRHFTTCIALVGAFSLAIPAIANDCPLNISEIGGQAAWIAPDATVDGLALSVLQVQSQLSPDELLKEITTRWKANGYKSKIYEAAGWQVAGAFIGNCFYTLQLKPGNKGSYGYFSVSKPDKPNISTGLLQQLPVFPGSKQLTTVESNDSGKLGVVAHFTSQSSLQDVMKYYSQQLATEGWSITNANWMPLNNEGAIGGVITARKSNIDATLVIGSGKGKLTQITANLTDKP